MLLFSCVCDVRNEFFEFLFIRNGLFREDERRDYSDTRELLLALQTRRTTPCPAPSEEKKVARFCAAELVPKCAKQHLNSELADKLGLQSVRTLCLPVHQAPSLHMHHVVHVGTRKQASARWLYTTEGDFLCDTSVRVVQLRFVLVSTRTFE